MGFGQQCRAGHFDFENQQRDGYCKAAIAERFEPVFAGCVHESMVAVHVSALEDLALRHIK